MGLAGWLADRMPHVARTGSGTVVVRTVRDGRGRLVRVLEVEGMWQSATYLDERRFEPVFSYYRAFDAAFAAGRPVRRALMIGGGGYAWPKHVLATRPQTSIDVVELDAAVTRVARRWFFLGEAEERWPGRLRCVTADGRAYLDERAASRACAPGIGDGSVPAPYDVIVNDAFCGGVPVRPLATLEAAQAVRACLVPEGLYLANVVSASGGADVTFLRDVVATLGEAFAHVHVALAPEEDFAGEDNYLVAATDGPFVPEGAMPYDEAFLGSMLRD